MPLSVDYRLVEDLIPHADNARTHSQEQIAQIVASVREFGWTNPILVDGANGIIAGHGRIMAARKLGMVEVPVIELAGLSEEQKRAYIIADNQLALNAGWDMAMLARAIGDLGQAGFDLSLIGFSQDELAALSVQRNGGLTDPDDAPEPPVNPVTRPGDLWLCGRHRVLCGDATKAADVERVLGGVAPHLMVTDPPYGVDYDPNWRERYGLNRVRRGKVNNDDCADWREAWALFSGDVVYVWHGMLRSAAVVESLATAGFIVRAEIVWDKTRLVISRGDYHAQHESAWYAVRKGRTGHWTGDRKQTTVWAIPHLRSESGHGTQKPMECMRRPIVNNSSPGQAVYDPFLGSGTTMIAAEMEGRSCFGLEISPAYCDVIVQRWQDFTGQAATLDGDDRTFEAIEAERYGGNRNKDMAGCYDVAIEAKRKKLNGNSRTQAEAGPS